MNSWSIFENWNLQKNNQNQSNTTSWIDFDCLNFSYSKILEVKYKELIPLIDIWDNLTLNLGKDPTHINWNNFRPLKLSREEDWSDWLAFLLENSESGLFVYHLLNLKVTEKPKKIYRELVCGKYRADIVINWKENNFTHIEVKIGDQNLLKTFDTSLQLENKFPNTKWEHYILILSNQVSSWNEINILQTKKINLLTWENITIALRKTILEDENLNWKVWAYSFIGVIEQNLIGFKGHLLAIKPKENLETKLEILKNSLKYG